MRQSNPSELLYGLCARGWIETLLVLMLLLLALVLTLWLLLFTYFVTWCTKIYARLALR